MLQHFRLDPLESNRRACSVSLLAEETIGTLIMVAWKPHLRAHQTRWFVAMKSCNISGLVLWRQTEKSVFRFLTSWCSPNSMVHGEEELQHFRLEPLEANREERVQVLCWQQRPSVLLLQLLANQTALGACQT